MVVEFYGFDFVERPAYALILFGFQFSYCKRSKGLAVIVGPQAKLVNLFRAASFVDRVGVLPSIPRLSYLKDPRVRAPQTKCNEVDVSYERFGKELYACRQARVIYVVLYLCGRHSARHCG